MQNLIRFLNTTKRLFLKILNPGFETIAWQVIYRVEVMGIGMTIIYLVYDLFFNEGPTNVAITLALFPLYILFFALILKYPGNKWVQTIVIVSNFLSMLVSFMFLAGPHYISSPTVIDFSLSLLVTIVVYRNWQRVVWTVLHGLVLIFFITLSLLSYTHPEPNLYIMEARSDFAFAHVEIFSRLIFIFILGFTFIKEYDRQRQLVFDKNEEVNHLNKNLEELVKLRTEKLNNLNKRLRDYSFINSHKVRAPLARMMGIMNLIEAEKITVSSSNMQQYLDLLQSSADELDKVIQEMNSHLSEQEEI